MIPLHIHHFWAGETGEGLKVNSSPAWGPDSGGADPLANLACWQTFHRECQTHLWTPDGIADSARRAGLSLVAEAMPRSRSVAQRTDLAMLFVLWNSGGFWVDSSVRPLAACLHRYVDADMIRLSGAERLFMGAERRQQAIFGALGSLTLKIHADDFRFSATEALSLHVGSGVANVLDLDPKTMWGSHLERRRETRRLQLRRSAA